MKLIRKTKTEITKNGNKVRYGIFKCPECLQEIERPMSNGLKYKSCGSTKCEKNKNNFKHGGSHSKLYAVWGSMKQRILNPNNKRYKDYGGRGITICPEWTDKENGFIKFRDWALNNGYKENLVIDRENPDGNYEPSNCRFLTIEESNRNKTNTITMETANEIRDLYKTGNYTRKELFEKFKLSQSHISLIINNKKWKN